MIRFRRSVTRQEFLRSALPFLLTVLLAACAGQTGGGPNVAGTWGGEARAASGQTLPLTLQLTQSGTTLSGTLDLGSGAGSVNGTVVGELVSLSSTDASGTVNLEASVSGSSMTGRITVTLTGGQTGVADFSAARR